MNKARPNSKLLKMPQAQIDQLAVWLIEEAITYPVAVERLRSQFAVYTSEGRLSEFYHAYCTPLILARQKADRTSFKTGGIEIIIDSSRPGIVRLIIPAAVVIERSAS